MIAFRFQYSNQSMLDSLQEALMEWISHIEIDQDKYSVEIMPMECHDQMYGRLVVKYGTMTLFFVDFYKKYGIMSMVDWSLPMRIALHTAVELSHDRKGSAYGKRKTGAAPAGGRWRRCPIWQQL